MTTAHKNPINNSVQPWALNSAADPRHTAGIPAVLPRSWAPPPPPGLAPVPLGTQKPQPLGVLVPLPLWAQTQRAPCQRHILQRAETANPGESGINNFLLKKLTVLH